MAVEITVTATVRDRKLCTLCIANEDFKDWIQEHGEHGACESDTSHGSGEVVSIGQFSLEVDEYFRGNYGPGELIASMRMDHAGPGDDIGGEPFRVIIGNFLGCTTNLVDAIAACLPGSRGRDPFYNDATEYLAKHAREHDDLG